MGDFLIRPYAYLVKFVYIRHASFSLNNSYDDWTRVSKCFPCGSASQVVHSGIASCVGWSSGEEFVTCADDQKLYKWSVLRGEKVLLIELPKNAYPSSLHWHPPPPGAKMHASSEVLALGTTDGKVLIISRAGRIEKSIEAHKGATCCVQWSRDGTALATGGEDGLLKIWSRAGMLRSTLAQSGNPVYDLCWSSDSENVVYTSEQYLVTRSLQPASKPNQWKAHDEIVLRVDWCKSTGIIISGGEDCRYKVWDSYGRLLYQSLLHDSPITSLAWSPDESVFAVGGFELLRLCDSYGWSRCLERCEGAGSIYDIAWAPDGTQLAAACGSGRILSAVVVDKTVEWDNYNATTCDENSLTIRNISNGTHENVDFKDRIIKMSIAYDKLVVTTPTQCYLHTLASLGTPNIIDLKEGSNISLIKQADNAFLLLDNIHGLQVFSIEGRLIYTPKLAGQRPDAFSAKTITLSSDTLAMRDRKDMKIIHVVDLLTGKPAGDSKPITHSLDITEIQLDQTFNNNLQQIAFIDRNQDLYTVSSRQYGSFKHAPAKIGAMVSCFCWHNKHPMLAGIQDGELTIWYLPVVVNTDRDILPLTIFVKSGLNLGKSPQLISFIHNTCTMRRGDGSIIYTLISPYPSFLHEYLKAQNWEDAMRLCRFVHDPGLWACLAAMSVGSGQIQTAEVSYAAIKEIDKVEFLGSIRDITSPEVQRAHLALLYRQPQQAEAIYIQAGLIYRAIELNIKLYNWERAIALAVKHQTHIDTVLAFRKKFLETIGHEENRKKFKQFASVELDWEKINVKIEAELAKEHK